MTARVRKAIGSVVIIVFMLAYIIFASGLGQRIPANGFVRFAFYLVAGVGWSLPLIPLMIWMNRGR
jgi:hypothetical protein